MLFKKEGQKVHFKKKGDIHSLRGYSAAGKSGGVEIIFRETYIEWKGLKLPLKLSPDNIYETQMLSYRVKYVRLLRKPGKRKDRWYAQLSLEGKPVIKYNPKTGEVRHPIGKGAVGRTSVRKRLLILQPPGRTWWNSPIRCRMLSRKSAAYSEN